MSNAIRLAAFASALFLGACGAAPSQEAAAKPNPLADGDAKARNLVLGELRDPGSAQFRNVLRVPMVDNPDDLRSGVAMPYVYCGEVNAKNGHGGYTGFVEFAVLKGRAEVRDPQMPLNMTYNVFCQRDGKPRSGERLEFDTSG